MQQLATACQAAAQAADWGVWLLVPWILWEGQAWVEEWAVWAVVWVAWAVQVLWVWVDQAHWALGLQVVWGLLAVLVAAYWRGGRLLHLQQALLLLLREHW